jgi:hypothetical protein
MGEISDQFNTAFRDFETPGVPSSGARQVDKADVRELGPIIEGVVSSGATAHGQALWQKIRAGQENCSILFLTDSTGDASNEWPYRYIAEDFAPQVPEITIQDRLYVDGSGWGSATTIQTGTGARTLTVARACVSGSGFAYSQGGKEAEVILSLGLDYDLVIVSHGHNFGYLLTESTIFDHALISMANLMALAPRADFFVTLQNPWLRYLSYSRGVRAAFTRVAAILGLGIIDIYAEFAALGDLDSPAIGGEGGTIDLAYYQQDGQGGLHPSQPAGQNVSLPAVRKAMAERVVAGVPTLYRPFSRIVPCFNDNPAFTDWTGAAPAGFTLNNVTVAKSAAYTETGQYCMAVTVGAGDPSITFDLSKYLASFAGRDVFILARVRVPASMINAAGNSLRAGRVQLATTGPSGNRAKASLDLVRGTDGWRYAFAIHSVRENDASLTGTILCGFADGTDTGETFHVQFCMVGVGNMPGALDPRYLDGGFIPDLYNFAETGIPSGFTGTLALSGAGNTTITVTGGTAGTTRAFLNIRTVAGRRYRLSSGIRTVTGAAGLTVSARGADGAGTVIDTFGPWINNSSLTFTATGSLHSFSINGGADVTAFSLADIKVVELFDGISTPIDLPIVNARNSNLTPVDATGTTGRWRFAITIGSAAYINSEPATGATTTSTAIWEVVLPANYIPGRDLTIVVNSLHAGSGVVGATRTIDVSLYRMASDGTSGTDLVSTTAQSITTSAADYSFTAAGATLAPGDRIQIVVIGAIQETGGTNSRQARINSLRIA